MLSVAEHLARVRQRIHEACQRSGRDPAAVTLVGVTKTVPLDAVQAAIAAGLTDVGESRVQEAREKFPALPSTVRRHLIGHLQRNKAKHAIELFHLIHSVDAPDLARELHRQAIARSGAPPVDVLIQVNLSGEASKFGCSPPDTLGLARAVAALSGLRLKGLMTIPPAADHPEQARPYFKRLRQLRDILGNDMKVHLELSMGMSHDFEVAIEEGADLIRVGTAIFGERTVAV